MFIYLFSWLTLQKTLTKSIRWSDNYWNELRLVGFVKGFGRGRSFFWVVWDNGWCFLVELDFFADSMVLECRYDGMEVVSVILCQTSFFVFIAGPDSSYNTYASHIYPYFGDSHTHPWDPATRLHITHRICSCLAQIWSHLPFSKMFEILYIVADFLLVIGQLLVL